MVQKGIEEEVNTMWALPGVFAPGKNESLWFCVHYRRFDAMTKEKSYFMPRMDRRIVSFEHATFFSTLNAMAGYWKVGPDEGD